MRVAPCISFIGGLILKESIRLRSGATVPQVSYREAQAKNYLDRATLKLLHLTPDGAPAAYSEGKSGGVVFWFDPEKLTESDPEIWYAPDARQETLVLESGTEIERMSMRRAASFGYYPKERLTAMHLEVIEEPVAFTRRRDKEVVYFYDKMTTLRMPLMCVKCGKDVRFKKKLCRSCYEEDLAVRRAEGDAHRNAYYGMDRSRVLFFDLELTGFYDHDEIISISIFNALGEKIMDTLVRPVHTKKWKRTEKIHGITPDMVKDAQTLEELTPRSRRSSPVRTTSSRTAFRPTTATSSISTLPKRSARSFTARSVAVPTNSFATYTSIAPISSTRA